MTRRSLLRMQAGMVLLFALLMGGCNSEFPGLVPVSGKLTLKGRPWPKRGQIFFGPTQAAPGRSLTPAAALINEDGTFNVRTSQSMGLMPGEYRAAIICAADDAHGHEGGEHSERGGRSLVPERYQNGLTSPLSVTVPEGGKPIVLNWDIDDK